jgi:hypothetical protein
LPPQCKLIPCSTGILERSGDLGRHWQPAARQREHDRPLIPVSGEHPCQSAAGVGAVPEHRAALVAMQPAPAKHGRARVLSRRMPTALRYINP